MPKNRLFAYVAQQYIDDNSAFTQFLAWQSKALELERIEAKKLTIL
ncbi:MAG: hypothetical protein LBS81_02440 [Endomicrobium sp.]|jgi:hypothetical protein|nr:hypothetical protein [Endomicrobium sp.]